MIFLDIVSEVVILIYHDVPLCDLEDQKILENNIKFQIARIVQIFVVLAWVGALTYMVLVVRDINSICYDKCSCVLTNPALTCNDSLCPVNSCGDNVCEYTQIDRCLTNFTIPERSSFTISNCTYPPPTNLSKTFCLQTHPSLISCILLGMILLEGFYQTIGIFFKSYLLPITIPDYVMFQQYLMHGNINGLIDRFGKSEFGFHWSFEQLTENPALLDNGSTL